MPFRFLILAHPSPSPDAEPAPRAERVVELDEGLTEIRFGRRPGLEIELPFPALASVHARMSRPAAGGQADDAGWTIQDLGGPSGTWVDGVPVNAGGARDVVPGAIIRLAHVTLR